MIMRVPGGKTVLPGTKEQTMFKKVLRLCSILLLGCLLLTGCGGFEYVTEVPSGTDAVTGNGTMAVRKGDYVYFVNGQESNTADNSFGTPIKGSVMYAKLDENDQPIADTARVVVPKIFYSSNTSAGIWIFGDSLFYLTPSQEKDRDGNLLTSYTEVYRCGLNGQNAKRLALIGNNSFNFTFTEQNGTVYFVYVSTYTEKDEEGTDQTYTGVYSVNTATGASVRIAEKVTNTPVLGDDGFVYFTQDVPKTGALEEGNEAYNKFSKVAMDGSGEPTEVVDKNGKLLTQKFVYSEGASVEESYQQPALTVSPLFVKNGAIFFSRNDGTTDGSTAATFYYVMNQDGDIRMLSNSISGPALSSLIPISYDQGMLAQITSNEVKYLVQVNASGSIFTGNASPLSLKNILRGTFTVFGLNGNNLFYADADNRLCSVDITSEELSLPAFGKDPVFYTENGVNTTYLKPVLLDGVAYFINTTGDYTGYLYYCVKGTDEDGKETFTEVRLGQWSVADQEAYEAAQSSSDEA